MSDASAFSADQAREDSEVGSDGAVVDPLAALRAQLEEMDERAPVEPADLLGEIAALRDDLASLRALVSTGLDGISTAVSTAASTAASAQAPDTSPELARLSAHLGELESALTSPEGVQGRLDELCEVTGDLARVAASLARDLQNADAPSEDVALAAAVADASTAASEDLSARLEEILAGDEPDAPRPATAGLHERLDALALELRASLEALLSRPEPTGQLDHLTREVVSTRTEIAALREHATSGPSAVLPRLVEQVTALGTGLLARVEAVLPQIDAQGVEAARQHAALVAEIAALRAEVTAAGETTDARTDANVVALRAELTGVSAALAALRVQFVDYAGDPVAAVESLRGELGRVLEQVTALGTGLLAASERHASALSTEITTALSGGDTETTPIARAGDLDRVAAELTSAVLALAGASEGQHGEVQAVLAELLMVTEELRERSGDVEDTPLGQLRTQVAELAQQARDRGNELEARVSSVLDARLGELHAGITLVRERAADHATRAESEAALASLHEALTALSANVGERDDASVGVLRELTGEVATLLRAEVFDERIDHIESSQRDLAISTAAGLTAVRDRLDTLPTTEHTDALASEALERLAPREVLDTALRTESTAERVESGLADAARDLSSARAEIDDLHRELDHVRAESREHHDATLEALTRMQEVMSAQMELHAAETTRLVALATGQAAAGATEQVAVRVVDEIHRLEERTTAQLAEGEVRTLEALAALEERVISEAAGLLEQVVRAGAADLDDARRRLATQLDTVRTTLTADLTAVRETLTQSVSAAGDDLAALVSSTSDALERTEVEVTAAFADDLSAALATALAELASSRATLGRTGQDLTGAARTLLAYLAERDAVLEADRSLMLVDILDDLALSLSRAERRALTDRLTKALERRRENADAERYRQLVESGAVTPPPSSTEPARSRTELVAASERAGAMDLPLQRTSPAARAVASLIDQVPDRVDDPLDLEALTEVAPTPVPATRPSAPTPPRTPRPQPRASVRAPGRTVAAKPTAAPRQPSSVEPVTPEPAPAPRATKAPAKAPTKAPVKSAAKAPAKSAAKASTRAPVQAPAGATSTAAPETAPPAATPARRRAAGDGTPAPAKKAPARKAPARKAPAQRASTRRTAEPPAPVADASAPPLLPPV